MPTPRGGCAIANFNVHLALGRAVAVIIQFVREPKGAAGDRSQSITEAFVAIHPGEPILMERISGNLHSTGVGETDRWIQESALLAAMHFANHAVDDAHLKKDAGRALSAPLFLPLEVDWATKYCLQGGNALLNLGVLHQPLLKMIGEKCLCADAKEKARRVLALFEGFETGPIE